MTNADSAPACVLWLTGLPGSGKSTLASALAERLRHCGRSVEWIDGDKMRALIPGIGFDRDARERYLRHVAVLASTLERHGVTAVASLVSPYFSSREFARSLCRNFVEIYVSTSLEECERRDPKGLYRKAREGSVPNFTGVSDPYESPENPEITLDAAELSTDEAVNAVVRYLKQRALIK